METCVYMLHCVTTFLIARCDWTNTEKNAFDWLNKDMHYGYAQCNTKIHFFTKFDSYAQASCKMHVQ